MTVPYINSTYLIDIIEKIKNMKITYKADYSLKIILHLARHYPNELVQIHSIAERQDIPKKFLEQLLLLLKKGGFIFSKRGPKGGYYLSRNPDEIFLGEVVRFVSGSVYPIECIDPEVNQFCDFKQKCVFSGIWKQVGDAISETIDRIDFASLVKKEDRLISQRVVDYQI